MSTCAVVQKNENAASEVVTIDFTRLLGFRDLGGIGSNETEVAAALDAVHVKVGEAPIGER